MDSHCKRAVPVFLFFFTLLLMVLPACKSKADASGDEIVKSPDQIDDHISSRIETAVAAVMNNNGKLNDSISMARPGLVNYFYRKNDFENIWSSRENWLPVADSMFSFIEHAREYGLFPKDYHYKQLNSIRQRFAADSASRMNAALWTNADLMLTDAFMLVIDHLSKGRLGPDTLTMKTDTGKAESFYSDALKSVMKAGQVKPVFHGVEPANSDYVELRKSVKDWLATSDLRQLTYVVYPFKDSMTFVKQLYRRLDEAGFATDNGKRPDSASFAQAIAKYQKSKGLKVTGKAGSEMVKSLNNTDLNKFYRIAITLDRYKRLPKLPRSYCWVNLPAYELKVIENDTLALTSKVIVGKPNTRTPELYSEINNFVTYPPWNVPQSIIMKEMLPALRRNPGYLSRRGYKLLGSDGRPVDPYSVNWGKYKKGVPYRVQQPSGDNNSLGVMKFNFENKYSVYLHDTNNRSLFSRSSRALSHGCVRVQEWEKLARFLVARNRIMLPPRDSLSVDSMYVAPDTIGSWIKKRERHSINLANKLPLYIRYFTCTAKDGKLIVHDDIYAEDKILREKYFADKN